MTADTIRDALDAAWAEEQDFDAPRPLAITCVSDLQGREAPEREWLVSDWVPIGFTTGFYGDGGTGKSLLAQQLLTCAASGRQFVGLNITQCRALGIFCEDDGGELHRRQDAINRALDISYGDASGMAWVSRVGGDNLLMAFHDGVGELTDFWHKVRATARSFGARLLVLDTAADLFGGNENARAEVRQFVQGACTRLAQDINGAVVLCAHPSRAGLATGTGDSGSTGWSNAFRSRLYFERIAPSEEDPAPDPDIRKLSRKKANYASAGTELTLRYQRGLFVTDGDQSSLGWIDQQARDNEADRLFLALLGQLSEEGRYVSASEHSRNFAPRLMARMPGRSGRKKADFIAAMERAFEAGEIRVGIVLDAHRKPREIIHRTGQ